MDIRRPWVAIMLGLFLAAPARLSFAASKLVWSGNRDCRDIALTYDVEFSTTTQDLIDTIDSLGIRTTWFLLGESVNRYPELVKQVAAHHAIGNHTLNHPRMPKLTVAEMHRQLAEAEVNITAIAGRNPEPWWRPPYGEYDDRVLTVAQQEGYPYTIMWTIDPQDWNGPSVETIRRRIVDGAFPGAISLQHGFPPNTVEATRLAVGDLRAKGYQFVTIPETLGMGRSTRDFGGDTYTVQAGDGFDFIGRCHNVTGPRVAAYNEVADLKPGDVVRIPHRNEIIVRIGGARQSFAVYPRVLDGKSMVHVRVAEHLGASVNWTNGKAVIIKETKRIEITPGSATALVNGAPVEMGAKAVIENDRVLVPIRFIVEQLGWQVAWDQATYTVSITEHTH